MAGYVQANCAPVVRYAVFQNLDKYVCKICGKEFGSMMSLGVMHQWSTRPESRWHSPRLEQCGILGLSGRMRWKESLETQRMAMVRPEGGSASVDLGSLMGDIRSGMRTRSSFPQWLWPFYCASRVNSVIAMLKIWYQLPRERWRMVDGGRLWSDLQQCRCRASRRFTIW